MLLNELIGNCSNIAMLTKDEFLKKRNPDNKGHNSDVYQFDIMTMNRDYSFDRTVLSRVPLIYIEKNNKGILVYEDKRLIGIKHNDTIYYTPRTNFKFPVKYSLENELIDLSASQYKKVKYITDYTSLVSDISANNLKKYPHLINRIIINDEVLEIRSEKALVKDKGINIAILNSQGYVVGVAQNEWGATLISVVQEYKNNGLGQKLAKIWYEWNPEFQSGGFSPSGLSNALNTYYSEVRSAIKNGCYREWISNKEITKDKVNTIIAELPERKKKHTKIKKQKDRPMIFMPDEYTAIIYDAAFMDDVDEKYVYGLINLYDRGDTVYPYAVDYDPKYKKLTNTVMMQMIKNSGLELNLDDRNSDVVEIDHDTPEIDLKLFSKVEKQFRKAHDPYGEFEYQLYEIAESKWK